MKYETENHLINPLLILWSASEIPILDGIVHS